jgi:hypothetical protein
VATVSVRLRTPSVAQTAGRPFYLANACIDRRNQAPILTCLRKLVGDKALVVLLDKIELGAMLFPEKEIVMCKAAVQEY